jgi:hypothetical protein
MNNRIKKPTLAGLLLALAEEADQSPLLKLIGGARLRDLLPAKPGRGKKRR